MKHLLYYACVLPIATYGFRQWFFEGAKNKTAFKILTQMQRKAVLWITEAFCTSPTGGTEALAGLIPIHLHLRKLADRANLRIATPRGSQKVMNYPGSAKKFKAGWVPPLPREPENIHMSFLNR